MLARFSVAFILNAIIATLVGAVIVVLGVSARDSWSRLRVADRMTSVSRTTTHLFGSLHHLRLDRSVTMRSLAAEKGSATMDPLVRDARAREMPHLQAAALLAATNLPQSQATAADLEAGRGFAVVAQEVKALAAQTAKATGEIGTQIASMQAATAESVGAIKEIGGTIARISAIAATVAAAVEGQGAATQEIARNVQHAAQGTSQVATNLADVNRGATETGSASAKVLSAAQALSNEGSKLKLEVDKFLTMVRAA